MSATREVVVKGMPMELVARSYAEGHPRATRLDLYDQEGPYLTLTVNLPGVELGIGEVLLRLDGREGGIPDVVQGLVTCFKDTGKRVRYGIGGNCVAGLFWFLPEAMCPMCEEPADLVWSVGGWASQGFCDDCAERRPVIETDVTPWDDY